MDISMIIFLIILGLFVLFLVTRWYWCWYLKINARLEEQRKTNELLQDIYDALVQGNTVNAVTAGQIMNLGCETAPAGNGGTVRASDIPEL